MSGRHGLAVGILADVIPDLAQATYNKCQQKVTENQGTPLYP